MNAAIVTDPGPEAQAQATTPMLIRQVQVIALAERMHQLLTRDRTATLGGLAPKERRPLEEAAAVALALVDDDAARTRALYVAAHGLQDLSAQSPLQRRGLVEIARTLTDRFVEALAGRHTVTAARLQPFIERDARATREQPEGAI